MNARELLSEIPVADERGNPTPELLEVIQRIIDTLQDHEDRITALEP